MGKYDLATIYFSITRQLVAYYKVLKHYHFYYGQLYINNLLYVDKPYGNMPFTVYFDYNYYTMSAITYQNTRICTVNDFFAHQSFLLPEYYYVDNIFAYNLPDTYTWHTLARLGIIDTTNYELQLFLNNWLEQNKSIAEYLPINYNSKVIFSNLLMQL
jgi:hypothetical protein